VKPPELRSRIYTTTSMTKNKNEEIKSKNEEEIRRLVTPT